MRARRNIEDVENNVENNLESERMDWRDPRITATNEAGHAVIAILSGRRITICRVRNAFSGVTEIEDEDRVDPQHLLSETLTCIGGMVAESIYLESAEHWRTCSDCDDDRQQAWDLARAAVGLKEVDAYVEELVGRVRLELTQRWDAVEKVANLLMKKAPFSVAHDEIAAVLE